MKENRINLTAKKKLAIAAAIVVLILIAVGTGTVLAVGSYNQSTSIGETNAQNFAFLDAGVDPAEVTLRRTEFDYEQGQFVYEVEFTHDGSEYEYWIKASDGSVVKKESELTKIPVAESTPIPETVEITLEKAKELALEDAGVTAAEVTFTEGEAEKDDGQKYFELEFRTEATKYEYEIDRVTGHIFSKSKETLTVVSQPATEAKPEPDPEVKSEPAPEAESETTAETKSKPAAETKTQSKSTSQKKEKIGLDAAKKVALSDAGVKNSDVTYTKAELDEDDGRIYYDVEFKTDSEKYEYEIAAYTGKVTDKEKETIKAPSKSSSSSGNKTSSASSSSSSSSKSNGSSSLISLSEAKSAAAKRAGHSTGSVTFTKAKLESDDGRKVYELEFYKDHMEYDCEVDAKTGKILDYDSECEVCERNVCDGNHSAGHHDDD